MLKKNVCLTFFFFIKRNNLNQSKVPVKTIQLQDIKTKNDNSGIQIQTGKNYLDISKFYNFHGLNLVILLFTRWYIMIVMNAYSIW